MKLVKAIVRTTSLERIVKALQGLGVRHMTIFEVQGIGEQVQLFNPYTIHKMIQVVIRDEEVEAVTRAITDQAHTGLPGDGVITVHPVDLKIEIQTKERLE